METIGLTDIHMTIMAIHTQVGASVLVGILGIGIFILVGGITFPTIMLITGDIILTVITMVIMAMVTIIIMQVTMTDIMEFQLIEEQEGQMVIKQEMLVIPT